MPRNLYNRVELVAPVDDDKVRAELAGRARPLARRQHQHLGARLRRQAGPAGDPDGEPRNVQRELIERHIERCRLRRNGRVAGRLQR